MKHLHFDCTSGVAGDMVLAALCDAGAEIEKIAAELKKLPLEEFDLGCESVMRNGITASHLLITGNEEDIHEHHDTHDHTHEHDHTHKHTHEHEHHHKHEHAHDHEPHNHGHAHKEHAEAHAKHHHGPHRHLADMLGLVEKSPYSGGVKERAEKAFRMLAEAESKIHGKSPQEVHFHEVSGLDTVIDIFGAFLAIESLGIDSVSCSALSLGSGEVRCAHGILPVPAPATMEIIRQRGIPFRQTATQGELVTPTGAALMAVLADNFGTSPEMNAQAIGYGAGTRIIPDRPNVIRATIGETTSVKHTDTVCEIKTVIDDMAPELVANMMEECFKAGALDAYTIAATMKKGRSGVELTVLAEENEADKITRLIFIQGKTFGLRTRSVGRIILDREHIAVKVKGVKIRVKAGSMGGETFTLSPEYEDCRKAADELGIALKTVYSLAEEEARKNCPNK